MRLGDRKLMAGLLTALVVLAGVYGLTLVLGGHSGTALAAAPRKAAKGGDAACASGGPAKSVKTQEFGKPGAKVEIVALLPITHGCHVATEAMLKKIQAAHPKDVHLTIVDLFGPDAPKYQKKVGGGQRTLVSINGKTQFTLAGRHVMLERQEGMSYRPADLTPIVDQQIKAKKVA